MALTVAKAFNMAFEIWEARTSEKKIAEALRRDRESESSAGNESDTGLMMNLGELKIEDGKKTDLDGIIEFGLSTSPEKAVINDSGLQMSASKCDLIDWSAGEEKDSGDEFGFDDDFMHLDATFAKYDFIKGTPGYKNKLILSDSQ